MRDDAFIFVPAPERAVLLHEDDAAEPRIVVYQQNDIRWLGFGGPAVQSVMSASRPDALLLPYTRAMLTTMLFAPEACSLLNLGLGGGAFERFFRRRLPEIAVTSVEAESRVVEIARRWFRLDPDASCSIAPARVHVAQTTDSYDLIFCDLHGGERMAGELSDPGFWRDCAARLRTGGVLAINVLADTGTELLGLLNLLRDNFAAVALREIADHRNIVVIALTEPPPDRALLASRREALRTRAGIALSIDPDSLKFVGD